MRDETKRERPFERQQTSLAAYCLVVALSVVGAVLVLVSTSRYGAGISPDSLAYLSAAKSLIFGVGYLGHDQTPLVHWPPLLPALLALVGLFRPDLPEAARYTNAILFGLIVLVSGLWLLRNTRSAALAVLGSAAVLVSKPLLKASVFAWSEPLFVLFVVLSLFEISAFLDSGRWRFLVLAAAFAAAASLTRYTGGTVILTGVLLLLLQPKTGAVRKLLHTIVFGAAAALPVAAWLTRNYMVSSTLAGERHPSIQSLGEILHSALDTVVLWFVPSLIPRAPRLLIAGLLLAAVAGMLVLVIRRQRSEDRPAYSSAIVPFACFSVIYVAYVAASATIVATDLVRDRLLSPIHVPLILLIVCTIDQLCSSYSSKAVLRGLLGFGVALWLTYPVVHARRMVIQFRRDGAGRYLKTVWKGSEFADCLKRHPLPGRVYTNAPEALYILAGRSGRLTPVKPKAHGTATASAVSPSLLKFKKSLASGEETHLVWFENDNYRTYLHRVGELGTVCVLEPIVKTPDGAVYRVRPHRS